MAYIKKAWVDRVVQHPGRRLLTATGTPNEYDVTRAEGTVTQAGDAFSATNMNDLETRVEAGFNSIGIPGFFYKGTVGDASAYWSTQVTGGSIDEADAVWNFQSVAGTVIKIDIFSHAKVTKSGGSSEQNKFSLFDAQSFFEDIMQTDVATALGFAVTNTVLEDARKQAVQYRQPNTISSYDIMTNYEEADVNWSALTVGGGSFSATYNYYDIHYEAWLTIT